MKQDIFIVKSRTRVLKVYITDSSGSPYVLGSGEKLIFGVKKSITDTSFCIKKIYDQDLNASNQNIDSSYDQSSGGYSFTIRPDDTKNLQVGINYVYDIGLQNGNNYFTVIETSRFVLEGNVTDKEASSNA